MQIGQSRTCPWCQQQYVVDKNNLHKYMWVSECVLGGLKIGTWTGLLKCPHQDCQNIEVYFQLVRGNYEMIRTQSLFGPRLTREWVPKEVLCDFSAPSFADSLRNGGRIPSSVFIDYKEAVAIAQLSPRASAVLARRCLQGMIQDKHPTKEKMLVNQINELKPKVTPDEFRLMDSMRIAGNSGAHPEADPTLDIPMTVPEANHILEALSTLIKMWYIEPIDRGQIVVNIETVAGKRRRGNKPTP